MQQATERSVPEDAEPAQPHGFLRAPEPRSLGDARRGRLILGGQLRLADGTLTGDPFTQIAASDADSALLNGFGWLDDLAAVGTALARGLAQSRVLAWVRRNPVAPPDPSVAGPEWRPDVTGRRVLRWVFHGGTLLPGLDRPAASPVFASLHEQLGYLSRHAEAAPEGLARMEALAGLAIAALSLRGGEAHAEPALSALAIAAAEGLQDGTLPGRNPEALLDAAALLVWTLEVAAEARHRVPPGIGHALSAALPVLRTLRHADGSLPRAHGGGAGSPGRLDHVLGAADGPQPALGLAMGFARMARGGATLILDAAPPPPGPGAQAASLGLEFTQGRMPIIVGCGSGAGFADPWPRACRATACASTLVLDGLSSARLGDRRAGASLTAAPRTVWAGGVDAAGAVIPPDCGRAEDDGVAHLLAGHDGWRDSHGLTHLRELWLEPDGLSLRGEDSLAAVDEAGRTRFSEIARHEQLPLVLHFHLHPGVQAELRDGGVTLNLPEGEAWVFRHDGTAALSLAASVWFDPGSAAPVPTRQILLSAPMGGFARQIGWSLARQG